MMPRHTRNSSEQGYSGLQAGLAPSPAMYAAPSRMIPTNYYDVAPSSSSAAAMSIPPPLSHPSQQPQYGPYSTSAPSPTLPMPPAQSSQHRPSSGAWTQQDDEQLLAARQQGLNWNQIRDQYFQSKTPNACRKRHERLIERKNVDDWDTRRMQMLAKEYMSMRKEIWSGLAARTGEKWNVVEAKCMSNGLKNLQSAARAASRRDRLETGLTGYDDDSGISGIGLTPVDELDASYSSPATSSSGTHSYSSSASYHHQQQQQQPQQQHLQPHSHHLHPQHHQGPYNMGPAYYGGHGYSSSVSSTTSMSHGYVSRGGTGTSQDSSPYLDSQRLSSDMGIESLVHRSNGGRM
ncbi:hypothetical protein Trisim1_000236 [Trichoderma cf. simile WF8]